MNPQTPEQPTNQVPPETAVVNGAPASAPTQGVSKKTLLTVSLIAGLLIAALLALVIVLLTKDNGTTESSKSGSNSSAQNSTDSDKPVEQSKVVATLQSSDPDVEVELLQPRKVGKTLVVNYDLVNKSGGDNKSVSSFKAGVYTTQFGINAAKTNGGTAEPYAVSDDDGQKYGLARDDQNEPLASRDVDGSLDEGEKISGYVTLTLPPSGSSISVFLGDMSAFSGIKVIY